MKTPIEKVRLSFKCPVSIENLTKCGTDKFCASCNKTLIDFRNQDCSKIINRIDQDTCGIFSTKQTKHISKKHSLKRVLATTLITIGLTTIGENLLAQNDTAKSDKINQEIEVKEEIFIGSIIETMPSYKNGGATGLFKFLKENIHYPADSLEGRVYVQFTIDTTGKVIDPKILKSVSKLADEEALRVVKMLEFNPGTQRGKKVNILYTLPIKFNLNNKNNNQRKKKTSR
jgi:TonB family protein